MKNQALFSSKDKSKQEHRMRVPTLGLAAFKKKF